jgi:hypothetical protein
MKNPPSKHHWFRRLPRIIDLVVIYFFIYVADLAWHYHGAIEKSRSQNKSPPVAPVPSAPLPGEQILANYASPSSRPEDDLSMMAHAFSNLTLLIKGDAPFRMGANEEFAAALLGKNRDQLRFLPDVHRCLNAQGQLVDRWMTPLFFHVHERSRIDIRSAGPDRQMWTADDLHRRHDGQFLKGADLQAQSLDEAGRRPTGR